MQARLGEVQPNSGGYHITCQYIHLGRSYIHYVYTLTDAVVSAIDYCPPIQVVNLVLSHQTGPYLGEILESNGALIMINFDLCPT